jgi:predicted nucleic acid-binding Zn ribbon protein
MSADPRIKCELCGGRCTRQIGIGSGIIFKGSGFYETDYKDKKGTAPAAEKPVAASGAEKAATASGDKPESKTPAKPEPKPKAKKAAAE